MAYTPAAESYSRAANVPFYIEGHDAPEGWRRFDQIYSEIADATPTRGQWRFQTLIGACPSIAHLAPSTQRDILLVVLRDMITLPEDCDRVARISQGVYRWVFTTVGREEVAA